MRSAHVSHHHYDGRYVGLNAYSEERRVWSEELMSQCESMAFTYPTMVQVGCTWTIFSLVDCAPLLFPLEVQSCIQHTHGAAVRSNGERIDIKLANFWKVESEC